MTRRHTASDFWKKIDASAGPDACWPHTVRTTLKEGYGRIMFQGRQQLTHRIAYELSSGKTVSKDVLILHSCDNPACCNPLHLREGTNKDNASDRSERKRHWRDSGNYAAPRGERSHFAKLNAATVASIRSDHASKRFTYREIARNHCTTVKNVCNIVTRVSWKHVP